MNILINPVLNIVVMAIALGYLMWKTGGKTETRLSIVGGFLLPIAFAFGGAFQWTFYHDHKPVYWLLYMCWGALLTSLYCFWMVPPIREALVKFMRSLE